MLRRPVADSRPAALSRSDSSRPAAHAWTRRPGAARPTGPTAAPSRRIAAHASDHAAAARTGHSATDRAAAPSSGQARRPAAAPASAKIEEGNLRERVSKRPAILEPPPIDREITIAEGITVKELSEKLGVKANLVIKKLVEKKIFATINQTLDVKLAEELAREFGASTNQVSYEEESHAGHRAGRRDQRSGPPRSRGHHHGPRRSR